MIGAFVKTISLYTYKTFNYLLKKNKKYINYTTKIV